MPSWSTPRGPRPTYAASGASPAGSCATAHTTTPRHHNTLWHCVLMMQWCGACSTRVVFPPCDTTQFQEIELDVAQRNNVIMSLGTFLFSLFSLSLSPRRTYVGRVGVVLSVAHVAQSNDSPVPRGEGPQAAGAGVRAPAAEPHLRQARVGRLRAPAARRRLPRTRRPAGETPTLDHHDRMFPSKPQKAAWFTHMPAVVVGCNSCWTRWRPWPWRRAW
jgi:hypothetical protein